MEIKELVEKYAKDILDETNQKSQNDATLQVFTIIVNEMSEKAQQVTNTKLKRKEKKEKLEAILSDTNEKYRNFTSEINKLAQKELLKPNGMEAMLKKAIKF